MIEDVVTVRRPGLTGEGVLRGRVAALVLPAASVRAAGAGPARVETLETGFWDAGASGSVPEPSGRR